MPAARSSAPVIGLGVQPTSTAVPARQSAMPVIFAGVTGSRIHTAATSVAKSGESALRIAAVEASIVVSAFAMRTKGAASPTAPTKRNARQCLRHPTTPPVALRKSSNARPATTTRSSMSGTGPNEGTA